MNIDEKIKQELETEQREFDDIIGEKQGLWDLAFSPLKGGLRGWFIAVNIITLVVTGFMFWTGYEFFIAKQINNQIFWGVCFLMTLNAQIALKQWVWMEMNRGSLMREVKRVEVAIAKLGEQLK
ncbi:DUF6768 family protein [Aliikangiella sp. IMCC44359]|uniref:DUF6768 family protein n=1 Tax=Aliikangiella sp. IMCC44359 TaxID=3459125 RepID=UPI00403B0A8C